MCRFPREGLVASSTQMSHNTKTTMSVGHKDMLPIPILHIPLPGFAAVTPVGITEVKCPLSADTLLVFLLSQTGQGFQ